MQNAMPCNFPKNDEIKVSVFVQLKERRDYQVGKDKLNFAWEI